MKLSFGDMQSIDKTKRADMITETRMPVIFGVVGGAIIALLTGFVYKRGGEDMQNAENRALYEIGALEDFDPNKKENRVYAKVLK